MTSTKAGKRGTNWPMRATNANKDFSTEKPRLEVPDVCCFPFPDTGDKGPNTHWVHGENIEIAVNM